jgi:hypothetical protein
VNRSARSLPWGVVLAALCAAAWCLVALPGRTQDTMLRWQLKSGETLELPAAYREVDDLVVQWLNEPFSNDAVAALQYLLAPTVLQDGRQIVPAGIGLADLSDEDTKAQYAGFRRLLESRRLRRILVLWALAAACVGFLIVGITQMRAAARLQAQELK